MLLASLLAVARLRLRFGLDGHRSAAGLGQMGGRPDSRCPHPEERLDRRHPGQPRLVVCWRRRSRRGQFHLPTAVHRLHTKDAWTYTLNSESTYDWVADQWSVPVNFFVTKLLKIGDQPISIGVRYWAESPTTGAHDFGAR